MQPENSPVVLVLVVTTFLILILVGLIVTILYFYQKKRITFQENLVNTQLEIQEETFQSISREIHDNIGLSLTLAKLHLNNLTLESSQPPIPNVVSSIVLITQAINDLSDLSKSLNSEAIRHLGFLKVLEHSLDRVKKSGKYEISLGINGELKFIDEQTELVLFRITQEALHNIIKHSSATKIHFQIQFHENHLLMAISDNGVGINWAQLEKTKSKRIMAGLNNMEARAKFINGTCNVHSDDAGTTIIVNVPI